MTTHASPRKDDRRERILRAALEVFAKRGFHQAHLDEVARVAGVGKGTIYLYVSDKESLLREAVQHLMHVHQGHIQGRVESVTDPVEKLQVMLQLEIEHMRANMDLVKVIMAENTGLGFSPAFRASMASMRKRKHDLVSSIIADGQRCGVFRTDLDAGSQALAFEGITHGILFSFVFDHAPLPDPEHASRSCLEIFLSGVRAASPSA